MLIKPTSPLTELSVKICRATTYCAPAMLPKSKLLWRASQNRLMLRWWSVRSAPRTESSYSRYGEGFFSKLLAAPAGRRRSLLRRSTSTVHCPPSDIRAFFEAVTRVYLSIPQRLGPNLGPD